MEAPTANRYRSRILREMNANRNNPFNSPPSSTGSHGTVTMSSVFSDPEGESTRKLNDDIARVTAPRKLPVNWEAAHRKWPDFYGMPKDRPVPILEDNTGALSSESKENRAPDPAAHYPHDNSTREAWRGSTRTRAEMQPRVDSDPDLSSLLTPARGLSVQASKTGHNPSPLAKVHAPSYSNSEPREERRSSLADALDQLRRSSTEREGRNAASASPQMSSAKSSLTAVAHSPQSMGSQSPARAHAHAHAPNDPDGPSCLMPDVSHLGDFVTGTLRFSGSMKNGVPIFVKHGKVHDRQERPSQAQHHADVDGIEVPEDEEKIFVSMDMIRDEIISLQDHYDKVQEYAANLQQKVESLEGQLRSRPSPVDTDKDRAVRKLQEACDDINTLTRKLDAKDKELEACQKQLQSTEQTRQGSDSLRRDMTSLKHSRDALELENTSFRTENENLLKQTGDLQGEVESLGADNDTLRRQNQSLIAENRTLRANNATLTDENEDLQQNLDVVRQELDDAREEIVSLRQDIEVISEEKTALREDNASLVRHNEKYFNENKTLRREMDSGYLKLKEENDHLRQQLDHCRPLPEADFSARLDHETDKNETSAFFIEDITMDGPPEPTSHSGRLSTIPDATEETRTQQPGRDDDTAALGKNDTQKSAKNDTLSRSKKQYGHQRTRSVSKASKFGTAENPKVAFAVPETVRSSRGTSNLPNQGSKRRTAPQAGQFTAEVTAEATADVTESYNNPGAESCPALSDDACRVLDALCEHSCQNCTICSRITSHGGVVSSNDVAAGKKRVTVPRPVPVTDRDLSAQDPTMRPAHSPGHALAVVIKGLEDEAQHLQLELSRRQARYNGSDKALGRRERLSMAESIRSLLKQLEAKNDQIYSLYDVLEGQKAVGQAMSEEEIEMTVLNITGMTVRDVTSGSDFTWEGIPDM